MRAMRDVVTLRALARTAEDARTILERSPSFGGFIAAVKNGAGETDAS